MRLYEGDYATFRPGAAQREGKGHGSTHVSDRIRGAAAPAARARFAGGNATADRAHAAGTPHAGGADPCADARTEPHQYGLGRKNRPGVERRGETGNAGEAGETGAARGFLPVAADQRTSARQCENVEQAGAASLWRHPRKRGAASECGFRHADLAEQGPQPAVVVSRRVQSQYADAVAAAVARPALTTGGRPTGKGVPEPHKKTESCEVAGGFLARRRR